MELVSRYRGLLFFLLLPGRVTADAYRVGELELLNEHKNHEHLPSGAGPKSMLSDMCRKAARLYGSNQLAGEHIGRSREFVRRQRLRRDQRFKLTAHPATISKK